MPNHVLNTFMYVSDRKKFKELVINEKGEVDFNILIPRNSEELDRHAEYSKDKEVELLVGDTIKEVIINCISKHMSQYDTVQYIHENNAREVEKVKQLATINDRKQDIDLCLCTVYNKYKYGYSNSYDFARNMWGTKWNAYNQCVSSDLMSVEFDTAWDIPTCWLRELARHIDFTLCFADESIGYNCGIVYAKDGLLYTERMDFILDDNSASMWTNVVKGWGIEDEIEYERDNGDDEDIIKELKSSLEHESRVVKFYNSLFDMPFDKTKLMELGMLGKQFA